MTVCGAVEDDEYMRTGHDALRTFAGSNFEVFDVNGHGRASERKAARRIF